MSELHELFLRIIGSVFFSFVPARALKYSLNGKLRFMNSTLKKLAITSRCVLEAAESGRGIESPRNSFRMTPIGTTHYDVESDPVARLRQQRNQRATSIGKTA